LPKKVTNVHIQESVKSNHLESSVEKHILVNVIVVLNHLEVSKGWMRETQILITIV